MLFYAATFTKGVIDKIVWPSDLLTFLTVLESCNWKQSSEKRASKHALIDFTWCHFSTFLLFVLVCETPLALNVFETACMLPIKSIVYCCRPLLRSNISATRNCETCNGNWTQDSNLPGWYADYIFKRLLSEYLLVRFSGCLVLGTNGSW